MEENSLDKESEDFKEHKKLLKSEIERKIKVY